MCVFSNPRAEILTRNVTAFGGRVFGSWALSDGSRATVNGISDLIAGTLRALQRRPRRMVKEVFLTRH